MQCVLNRLLYVIFDKLPHINANFDFLPEPGGMENISIKQIMLEEPTWSPGVFTGKGDVFTEVSCIFSVWPFYTQIERNILKILCGGQSSLLWKPTQENGCENCLLPILQNSLRYFLHFQRHYFLNSSPWLVLWLAFISITNKNWTKKAKDWMVITHIVSCGAFVNSWKIKINQNRENPFAIC